LEVRGALLMRPLLLYASSSLTFQSIDGLFTLILLPFSYLAA
jgi:hypothetical protein